MVIKNKALLFMAVLILAAALADGGCIGTLRNSVSPTTPSPTYYVPTTPMPPSPVATATPVPATVTPTPDHVDLIYTAPLEAGTNRTSAIHVLTGNIVYNGMPAVDYEVLVDTVSGYEYGNKTDADGKFQVTFRDDGSPTYVMKIVNPSNIFLYTDKTPRPVSQTGPISIKISVPSTNQVSVSITP